MSTNLHIRPRLVKTLAALTVVTAIFAGVSIAAQASTVRASVVLNHAAVTTPLIQKPSDFASVKLAHYRRRHTPTTTTTVPVVTTTTVPAPAPTPTTTVPVVTTTTVPAPAPTPTTTVPAPAPAPSVPVTSYPVGVPSTTSPSGYAPPTATDLPGFTQSNVSDFTGSTLPSGWVVYSGKPGGDPGAQFGGASHAIVSGGLLSLNTFQDPNYGNIWVTGGLCDCGFSQTHGAYFVRSRVTGAGPTNVALLWPADNSWPPEIDFNETDGSTNFTTATTHYTVNNTQDQVKLSNIDMTQWHTWGVIWTPTAITYTVDGKVWGSDTNAAAIPNMPMTLDLQQQTWCSSNWACPTTPQSMQIDWAAQYSYNG
jgi:hypothetical protein